VIKEFKEFAMRGSVLDMAVGIIIGVAFGAIVSSFVTDVLMPPLGLLLGGVDFTNLFVVLKSGQAGAPFASLAAAQEAGAVTLNYGLFINKIISFLIVAFALFLVIRSMNRLKKKEAAPAGRADDQGLPLLLDGHPHPGRPLPELHFSTQPVGRS
jgi:large conductance mechanosensitive channel